uniref:Rho-GAP domain-containing protein n=1 Tax=Heterorhabditis bacteriophora TaxID=37862 RepID=A0A1I7XK95_HETBA
MRRGGPPHGHGPPVPSSTGLAFPSCVHEALVQVSKHVRLASHGRNRPVVAKISELQQLIDNDIFCLSSDRRISRLTALHQFNLLHILAQFFLEKSDDMNKYAYFEALFLGREGESVQHEHRLRTLFRLASFALQFPVLHLFSQISQWLSKMGAGKSYAEDLVGLLVEHFIQPDYETKMVFPMLLRYDIKCEYSDVETLSFHAGILAILERWGTKIKNHWISNLAECKIPASYASLIEDLQSNMLSTNSSEKSSVS